MPLPIAFIGIAAVTGGAGIGKTVKAGVDQHLAKKISVNTEQRLQNASARTDQLRQQCSRALEQLGAVKLSVLSGSMAAFVESFSTIKNVDLTDSIGIEELKTFHIDLKEFEALGGYKSFIMSLAGGSMAGVTGGALAAFGAYSAASTFAAASTGTAISALSGAAASNATLAFFGGGSLAAGGLGMAGGTAVLGGLVAGPALLVMGIITGAKAGKNLNDAIANAAEADEICTQLENGAFQCAAIRRRSYLFYSLLARLDAYFMPMIERMQYIIATEGDDYAQYSPESKRQIAACASLAVTIKAVLDTPLLTEEGDLTEASAVTCRETSDRIARVETEQA